MNLDKKLTKVFQLNDKNWMRHVNPMSVWTRFSVLSILCLGIWSRVWWGYGALIPIGLSVVWMFINPIIFKKPTSTKNWASKSVLGERIWIERDTLKIPIQFRSNIPHIANIFSVIGIIFVTSGLYFFELGQLIAGLLIVHGGKLWYLDRMVLLYEDMKKQDKKYLEWEF